jgi:hypothetical protein
LISFLALPCVHASRYDCCLDAEISAQTETIETYEIAKLDDMRVGVKKQVLRLDVPMANSHLMNVGKRACDLVHVELDVKCRDLSLGAAVMLDDTVDGLRNEFKDQIQVHLLRLCSSKGF